MRRKQPLGLLVEGGGGNTTKKDRGSWFQLNKHHHLQILATKGALVLGFPSH